MIQRLLLLLTIALFCSCKKRGGDPPPVPVTPPVSEPNAIRGAWITTTASTALNSLDNIKQTVTASKTAGLTHLFVVVYNNARTIYPSAVMQSITGQSIMPAFAGRDPLQEIITEAHAKGLKVHAWFEYGFAASYSANGGPILQAKPSWKSAASNGSLVVKNGFDWLNAFHPEVQDFMINLVKEVVSNYNVDGVQGDDRLPAMPVEGGYDDYTKTLYSNEHGGALPPTNHNDAAWIQWRAKKLNVFMKRFYTEVKALKPAVKVIMSPSVYPFSLNQYLQDWPTWVDSSWVDGVIPQIYRYDINAYRATLLQQKPLFKNKVDLFTPGVLLKSGTYLPTDAFLTQMIAANRAEGLKGEVFFFYEGVKDKINFFAIEYPYIR